MPDDFLFKIQGASADRLADLWSALQQKRIMPRYFSAEKVIFTYSEQTIALNGSEPVGEPDEGKLEVSARLIVHSSELDFHQASCLFGFVNRLEVSDCRWLAPLADEMGVWVFDLSKLPNLTEGELNALSARLGVDVNLLSGKLPTLSRPGVLVLDMDSTAIQIECIDELARLAGVGEAVAEVTELAMQGKLDFEASLRTRVSKLAGAPVSILDEVLQQFPVTPGLGSLVSCCQQAGWKIGIASGGFTWFASHLQTQFNLDRTEANLLAIADGKLTGEVEGRVVDAKFKADFLRQMCEEYRIPSSQAVAIGDGANDLPMLASAALGIAYHAKPVVAAQAQAAVRFGGLEKVIPLLRC